MTARSLRQSPSGRSFFATFEAEQNAQQPNWYVDPVNGLDSNGGTTENAPLKTLAMAGQLLSGTTLDIDLTVNLLADAPADDQLVIGGMDATYRGTITLKGRSPVVQSGIPITAVTPLGGPATNGPPYQLTTSGIDWTATTALRIRLGSAGVVANIATVVDANNIVASGFILESGSEDTPTTSDTLTLETVVQCSAPYIDCSSPETGGSSLSSFDGTIAAKATDLSFYDPTVSGYGIVAPQPVVYNGCKFLTSSANHSYSLLQNTGMLNCDIELGGNCAVTCPNLQLAGCFFHSTTATLRRWRVFNQMSASSCYFLNAGVQAQIRGFISLLSYCHFEQCAGTPISLNNLAIGRSLGIAPSGSTGNTGFGISLSPGSQYFYLVGNVPTVTGTSGDVELAGAATAYGVLPAVDAATLTAIQES